MEPYNQFGLVTKVKMVKTEKAELGADQRRAVGWIINVGLAWALAMAWGGQRWPAFGTYFLAAAAVGALAAMGSAALRVRQREGEASDDDVHGSYNQRHALSQTLSSAKPIQPDAPNFGEILAASRFERTLAELQQEDLKRLTTARVLETQIHYAALLARSEVARQYNLAHHAGRQDIFDVRSLVGQRYVLDFGTVRIEIDGDSAKVNLASSTQVTLEGPTFGLLSDADTTNEGNNAAAKSTSRAYN